MLIGSANIASHTSILVGDKRGRVMRSPPSVVLLVDGENFEEDECADAENGSPRAIALRPCLY